MNNRVKVYLALLIRNHATDLLVHLLALPPGDGLHCSQVLCMALPPVIGAALLLVHLLALLVKDSFADGVIHGGALLVHDLIALLLINHDTILLIDCGANIIHGSLADIVVDHLADIIMHCLSFCQLHNVALHLGGVVALLLLLQVASPPLDCIILGMTMDIIVSATDLPMLSLLHDFTLVVINPIALLDILVLRLGNVNLFAVHGGYRRAGLGGGTGTGRNRLSSSSW